MKNLPTNLKAWYRNKFTIQTLQVSVFYMINWAGHKKFCAMNNGKGWIICQNVSPDWVYPIAGQL